MKKSILLILLTFYSFCFAQDYKIVDTGVKDFYSNNSLISKPATGETFYGQDAHYNGNQPSYTDNGDGTITDNITGLMWQQADNGNFYDWEEALNYAENLEYAGYSDWRLPNAKELQSIVDYSRSPQATNSPAIDPVFSVSEINDPNGNPGHFPYFWTSTSHLDGANPYASAVYIAFGEAQGKMNGNLMDVHGAGAQRSDPKSGNANDYPQYFGPQGDVRYVYNAVRCVRDINSNTSTLNMPFEKKLGASVYPNPFIDIVNIQLDYESEYIELDILNILGQSVFKNSFQNTEFIVLQLNKLTQGMYFMKISGDERNTTIKILKPRPGL